jgi:molybdopterin converting factor small subunit
VRIELYGIARARAGTETIEVPARSVAEAVQALAEACPALVPEVVQGGRLTEGWLASLNGDRFVTEDTLLGDDDVLVIMGAQAGG